MERIEFNPVKHQCENVIIVASGPSSLQFKPIEGWKVIAVNAAIHLTKNDTDFWFTLDPSEENREIMVNKPYDCYYYAAVPIEFGSRKAMTPTQRKPAPKEVHYLERCYDPKNRLGLIKGLSESHSKINTGNSGYGALGLALLLGAKRVIIIGIDGSRGAKIDGSRCIGTLDHLPELFESSAQQLNRYGVEVINGSPKSSIKCFPRITFTEAIGYFNDKIRNA